ncbi:MAG: hypothetical protein WDZ47_01235 [Bacteroidales bacterium]
MKYSCKHILHKHLKAIIDEHGTKLYRVYIQIIWKRKNYMFSSLVKTHYADLSIVSHIDKIIMDAEMDLIERILKFEIGLKEDKFDLPGFADKLNHYRRSVVKEAERLLFGSFEAFLKKHYKKYVDVINTSYKPNKFGLLLEAAEVLNPEIVNEDKFKQYQQALKFWQEYQLSFPEHKIESFVIPSVFDWVCDNHIDKMKTQISINHEEPHALLLDYLDEFDFQMRTVTIGG